MSRVARLEAQEASIREEMKLAILEDDFVAKKLAGTLTREDRLKLREVRRDWRLNHRPSKPNTARPPTIGASTEIEEV